MLEFEPFSIDSLQKIIPILRAHPSPCSDMSAGSLFMWAPGTGLRFCIYKDTLVISQEINGQPAFTWPAGNDPHGTVAELIKYTESRHLPLRFYAVDRETLKTVLADPRLIDPMWSFDPQWSDYVYDFRDAMTFPGSKFHGQRNHVNKFTRLYGAPDVRFLTPDDKDAVLEMLALYEAGHAVMNKLERLEFEQAKKLLEVYPDLGLYAAGLFVDGRVAAFSIGEISGSTLFIHVEKALTRYEGAYPVMYSGFVRLMDAVSGHTLTLVNREDDSGDPGIRVSKMQYHPVAMVEKYLVHVNAPAKRLPPAPEIKAGHAVLTPFRESDRKNYFDLCADVENNKYWGYDYRDDYTLTGPLDENTFYDSAAHDMATGDSINFAIRLSSDGEMAGEAILWNFTYDGFAELGCRLLPRYQGSGIGTFVFKEAASFAEDTLGLKVCARCCHENIRSRRMILSSGFTPCGSDGEYEYFSRGGFPWPYGSL
ncbi:MAG: GNAT family N-acetyltransferase [Clostridia bacterium]|nr:GNAT family N-acetyltransferase [Clostridia bacterium]